ncbi:ISNCY-like element ISSydi1 family transposase [Candidatus Symbiothrix dinenymphae]|uniref:ISNCY-like element ISSydi1 family transposase n=1 Tax=Candidatus Symbiothrix dinenymphae TaxID=467085 RepID=UPI000702F7B9|nr:ISNCY-like element ISSydi1 family transposase [Candidatus Symbiothrix dinenymphae]
MKMQLFEPLRLKFESANWAKNPELGLFDTILELHPELIKLVEADVVKGCKLSKFGRQDMPSVEQIMRAAIYKEVKGLDYRELEEAQEDSRICEQFLKIDSLRPYSFQVYQKYISKITADSLEKLLVEINKIAISEGLEDVQKLRQDSTVVETNIHYPTNNSLIWDCIKESHRLLTQLNEEVQVANFRDYRKNAKRTYFLINNTKSSKKSKKKASPETATEALDKRTELFRRQLITFTKCINQVSNVVKKKDIYNVTPAAFALLSQLEFFVFVMRQVYDMTQRHEIKGETVSNAEKIFSIYEQHTDIIVKGQREVLFGHKVDLASGRSNLILGCDVCLGNPADSSLYQGMVDKVIKDYGIVPRDSATDGGYASKANMEYALSKGIRNVVFNKIVGSLRNVVSSKNMETRLKKWRSGMEAVISNVKRGYDLFRCNWKGQAHFAQKVLWSVIAYNIRVMTAKVILSI